ncbi:uncharacterized protein PV09_05523 [Verruconis gallopava]|uniref:Uncharacterized protein n=1 Tax=Verruconis gallopava TaxID=253628 RepID=A0A0D1YRR2_9PEZI|nr:uncharacterized protein PV09_05523 [Verruconis gallopava]KIW03312.1 hypothetical protein PV09_05523 [Verruconis gallopava]
MSRTKIHKPSLSCSFCLFDVASCFPKISCSCRRRYACRLPQSSMCSRRRFHYYISVQTMAPVFPSFAGYNRGKRGSQSGGLKCCLGWYECGRSRPSKTTQPGVPAA